MVYSLSMKIIRLQFLSSVPDVTRWSRSYRFPSALSKITAFWLFVWICCSWVISFHIRWRTDQKLFEASPRIVPPKRRREDQNPCFIRFQQRANSRGSAYSVDLLPLWKVLPSAVDESALMGVNSYRILFNDNGRITRHRGEGAAHLAQAPHPNHGPSGGNTQIRSLRLGGATKVA